VMATGYKGQEALVRKLFGEEVAARVVGMGHRCGPTNCANMYGATAAAGAVGSIAEDLDSDASIRRISPADQGAPAGLLT